MLYARLQMRLRCAASPARLLRSLAVALALAATPAFGEILPPGHRPLPPGVHALKATRVVMEPGRELTNAIILVRDGRFEAVGSGLAIPADARVWVLTNATIYAGFIDLHVPVSGRALDTAGTEMIVGGREQLTAGSINFSGVPGGERDPGQTGPGHELAVIRPEFRVADVLAPTAKELESL
ncbi:MAG TPA: hypothetical protein DCY13_09675, partial [Verrucomicrobiales bacterium]|nr:hypothetical protein [Verrucomicrobiales bacterium]